MWPLREISIMPTVDQNLFLVEKCFDSWDPKIHSPRKYLHSFMWPLSLRMRELEALPTYNIYEWFQKYMKSSYKGMMVNGTCFCSFDF